MLKTKSGLRSIAYVLIVIGALNWGLIGLFQLNIVNVLFGAVSALERLVYVLVGLSAVLLLLPDSSETKEIEESHSVPSAPQPELPREMQSRTESTAGSDSSEIRQDQSEDRPLPPPSV